MKNIVYVIVDAFCYKNLNRKVGNAEVTPFLNRLAKQSLRYTNMYTQAPYTEASLVSLLSGENTLDSGGYMFGNGTTGKSIFDEYKEKGYRTMFSYSPYVYSKAYLKSVTDYYYTRLYSIEPLLLYRLDYYYKKWQEQAISEEELQLCAILLEEAIETWKIQCSQIIEGSKEIKWIEGWLTDIDFVKNTLQTLGEEEAKLSQDRQAYAKEMFANWQDNTLRKLNRQYIQREKFLWRDKISLEEYKTKFAAYQKKYHEIIKNDKIDLDYAFGMIFRNKDGLRDAKNTLLAYKKYYSNMELANYVDAIDERAKVEVSMRKAFDVYYDELVELDKKNEKFFAHIHMQEFHLPSIFHTLDTDDPSVIKEDFDAAVALLDKMDASYKGNIIADLSANYCDRQIERFFYMLKQQLKNEFVFVVTADHGFPSYEQPPRPIVYNQTYSEAFHVPFILYDGESVQLETGLFSDMDAVEIMKEKAGIKPSQKREGRDYILCEYGGPGCPDIGVKEIWYTYIDKKYRVSVQAKLEDEITTEKVVAVFDLEKDPSQKKDLYRMRNKDAKVKEAIQIIGRRHATLQKQYGNGKFIKNQLNAIG